MAKYRITRRVNKREGEYLDIYATSDDKAKVHFQQAIKSYRDDWEYVEGSLGSAATDDAEFDLECIEDRAHRPVQMGFRPKSQMPYSDEAREFVRKIACVPYGQELPTLWMREARKLCGME